MRSIMRWASVVLAMIGATAAGAAPITVLTKWRVSLDGDGRVTKLVLADELAPTLAEPLRKAIAGWNFSPGRVDGSGVATETTLNLEVRLEPAAGGYAARVASVQTGAGVERTVPPRPSQRFLARVQKPFAELAVVEVAYDDDGGVTSAELLAGAPQPSEEVATAVLRAVRRWAFVPERVAGQALPGSVQVPVCITVAAEGAAAPACAPWTPAGQGAPLPTGSLFTPNPAARLLSDTSAPIQ